MVDWMAAVDWKRGPERAHCETCGRVAWRVGAQDGCDIYLCVEQHITRVPLATGQRLQQKEATGGR